MKKITTVIASLLITLGVNAQIVSGQNHNNLLKAKNDKITMSGNEALSHLMVNPNPTTAPHLKTAPGSGTETVIGSTTYDLQSNGSVQNRIIHHDNGSISAGWTMSTQYNTAYPDRGTGYSFFDGSIWDAQPTDRLEGSRGGWPSIIAMGSGKEASVTHNTDNSYINMTHRSAVGTGSWTEQTISSFDDSTLTNRDLTWNRTVVGGTNKETLHMIAIANAGDTVNQLYGITNALVYYRSQDEGVTWDIQDMQLPTLDSANFNRFGGDSYSITAQGNTVALAYFNDWGDSFILKSTDNGDTWAKTIFLDFPVDKYLTNQGLDLDGNDTMDHVYSTDNYGAIILDANNTAHVFYGAMQYADDDLTDLSSDGSPSSSYYPGTNLLAYWNESFGADYSDSILQDTIGYTDAAGVVTPRGRWWSDMMNDHIIASAPDLNNDGDVSGIDSTGGYALYYASRASMPNAGISANGEIYLSFSGYTETADNGSQVFRHIYITKSSDGGITWKDPVDVTPHTIWDGARECVFGSMNPVVDDKIRIVYQQDPEPGLAVRGDEDGIDMSFIIYLEIDTVGLFDTTFTLSVGLNEKDNENSINIFPNPTKSITTLEIYSDKTQTIKISIIDLLGKEITKKEKVIFSGVNAEEIDVSEYQKGIYFINIEIGTQVTTKKLVITN